MRRAIGTETEAGSAQDAYLVEELMPGYWVLSRTVHGRVEILTTGPSPSELETIPRSRARVTAMVRYLLFTLAYVSCLAGILAGAISGSLLVVLGAWAVAVVIAGLAGHLTESRPLPPRISVHPIP